MSKYKYSGLIYCNECKKMFKGKMARKHKTYLCSGRNNYGVNFCSNDWQIKEEFLDFIVQHRGDREVVKIIVNKEKLKIVYLDKSFSVVDNNKIIF